MRESFGVQSWFYPLPVLIIGTYDANGKLDMSKSQPIAFGQPTTAIMCRASGSATPSGTV